MKRKVSNKNDYTSNGANVIFGYWQATWCYINKCSAFIVQLCFELKQIILHVYNIWYTYMYSESPITLIGSYTFVQMFLKSWIQIAICISDESHLGFYAVYLQEWLSVFPRDQILVMRTKDYSANTTSIMRRCSISLIWVRVHSFVSLFEIFCPTREFFTNMETSPLPVNDWKFWPMLGTCGHWPLWVLKLATTTMTRGIRL